MKNTLKNIIISISIIFLVLTLSYTLIYKSYRIELIKIFQENSDLYISENTISPKELAKILGIGINNARNIFDKPDFPKISKADIGNIGKADKEAARLYIQGIKIKNNSKEALLSMIYFELRKITANNEIDVLKSDFEKGKESVENENS